ncbi:MAG: DUF2007 domain-containing protein [Alphaproteobacteria bacterium]|nr:MAG: DUF2007 domain-containing protein [Alphaproteobacteria bacterium]
MRREIMRTNDQVTLSFVQAVLKDMGLPCYLADENFSIMEGSIGIFTRRLLVDEEDLPKMLGVLADPGIYPHLIGAVREEVDAAR